MHRDQETLLRNLIRNTLHKLSEAKPGGGLTDLGAKRRIAKSDALAQMRSEIEASDGDVPSAADRLGVAPSTLYLAIQQEPSLEKSKERADKDQEKKQKEKEDETKKESNLRWKYYDMLVEGPEESLPEPPPNYAEKVMQKLASASEGGVGMLTKAYGSNGISVVLYKTNVFVGNILFSLNTETGSGGDTQVIADATENSIVGMITLDAPEDACNDAMVVKYVFAKEEFGPTLYEIAMQLSPSGRIISDRTAVSDKAAKMYKVFQQRGDIEKKALDDKDVPKEKRKTPDDPSDDCEVWNHEDKMPGREFLDYSFGGASHDLGALKANHKEAMTMLGRYVKKYLGWSDSFAGDYLSSVADYMFTKVYHQIPMAARGLKN